MGYTNTEDMKEFLTDAFKERSKDSTKDFSTDSRESTWDMPLDVPCPKVLNPTDELRSPDANENPYQYSMHYVRHPGDIFSF